MTGIFMKLLPFAAAAALLATAPLALAGSLKPPSSPAPSDESASWIEQVSGKKFFAVDGSTVTLTQNDGGFTLDTIAPDGSDHRTAFNMLSDSLGSITEGDGKTVTGVFRTVGNDIEANFADGRTETVASNAAGGVTVMLKAPEAKSWCMRWYPQGHGFDEADKKQALAEYAAKLGLEAPAKDHAVSSASCIEPAAAEHPLQTAATGLHRTGGTLGTIVVRSSKVHLIDAAVATTPAQGISPPTLIKPMPGASADLAMDRPLLQNHGASSCLKIDNDGSSWGFRNACGYSVQFAWCLQKGADPRTACATGTGSGQLAANGFAALMPGSATINADNQFRWVACTGGNGVSAQLDRADPPAGRCIITAEQ
ncbi:MAG: hypothetical protein WBQ17_12060 [Rhizomicrobium sp.]